MAASSAGPAGNAAVAKKSATVNPIPAVMPTTRTSAYVIPTGRARPARTASTVINRIPIGFPATSAPITSHVGGPMLLKGTPAFASPKKKRMICTGTRHQRANTLSVSVRRGVVWSNKS